MLYPRPQMVIRKSENGEYLICIAYGSNEYRLEAYATLRRRSGSAVMVFPPDLERSLDAPKSNLA